MPQSLETHQQGTVVVNGTELSENTKNIEDVRRNIGMVFNPSTYSHTSACWITVSWRSAGSQAQGGGSRDGDEISRTSQNP